MKGSNNVGKGALITSSYFDIWGFSLEVIITVLKLNFQ
jgi:hypothetical protein